MHSEQEITQLCARFGLPNRAFNFPQESFLEEGYAPPGGYVKDFSVLWHEERLHLFHIDGRPQERCNETGNEVSFGHASTADLRHWVRHRMPLAVGDRPWEREHVWAPYVFAWRGRFIMVYMGAGYRMPQVLSYAVSEDLEHWEKWPDGPIPDAQGRDPFVREVDGTLHFYYSGHGGIHALATENLEQFHPLGMVMRNPERDYAESCSVHSLGDRFVLWHNDYCHVRDITGDFRAVYAISDDPLNFDPAGIQSFAFHTDLPTRYEMGDWISKRPIPVSIELVAKGKDAWLVAYFRWHIDRYRLFFGCLDWTQDPASITEIADAAVLEEVKARAGMAGPG